MGTPPPGVACKPPNSKRTGRRMCAAVRPRAEPGRHWVPRPEYTRNLPRRTAPVSAADADRASTARDGHLTQPAIVPQPERAAATVRSARRQAGRMVSSPGTDPASVTLRVTIPQAGGAHPAPARDCRRSCQRSGCSDEPPGSYFRSPIAIAAASAAPIAERTRRSVARARTGVVPTAAVSTTTGVRKQRTCVGRLR